MDLELWAQRNGMSEKEFKEHIYEAFMNVISKDMDAKDEDAVMGFIKIIDYEYKVIVTRKLT